MRHLTFIIAFILIGQITTLAQSPTLPLSEFCVANSQNYVITGGANAAYIYQRNSSNWTLQQTLSILDADPYSGPTAFGFVYSRQGVSLSSNGFGSRDFAIDGDLAYVGFEISAFDPNSTGAYSFWETQTYVYKRTGNSWAVVGILKGLPTAVQGQTLVNLYTTGISDGFSEITDRSIIYELSNTGTIVSGNTVYSFTWNEFELPLERPDVKHTLSQTGDVATISLIGDPVLFFGNEGPIKVHRKVNGNWTFDAELTPPNVERDLDGDIIGNYQEVQANFGDLLVLGNLVGNYSYQNGNWIYENGLPSNKLTAPTLSLSSNKAFVVELDWTDVVRKNNYGITISDPNAINDQFEELCQYQTSFIDTVLGFGDTYAYQVDAIINGPRQFRSNFPIYSYAAGSNVVLYTLPSTIQDLELSYVCYNAQQDSLTWSVFNPNGKDHPFIFAQWWSNQRDTLWAVANGTTTFKTKNNPQSSQTFGDDNITGIWWINQDLLPGQPFDLVMSGINLGQSCPANRLSKGNAEKAGHIYAGALAPYVGPTGPEARSKELLESNIVVGPNPTQDFILIQGLEGQVSLELMNQQGQIVLRKSTETTNEFKLSLKGLPIGMYILKVDGENTSFTEKVIKK